MIRKSRFTTDPLNDGLMDYGTVEIQRDAQKKMTGAKTFTASGPSLCFSYGSISDYDVSIYPALASQEDIKIKTYYVPEVNKGLKVQINGEIYDITGTNADEDRRYRYWLLTRVKA